MSGDITRSTSDRQDVPHVLSCSCRHGLGVNSHEPDEWGDLGGVGEWGKVMELTSGSICMQECLLHFLLLAAGPMINANRQAA